MVLLSNRDFLRENYELWDHVDDQMSIFHPFINAIVCFFLFAFFSAFFLNI